MLGQITDAPTSELEQARRIIQERKEKVEKYETQANEQGAKLNQGLFDIIIHIHSTIISN